MWRNFLLILISIFCFCWAEVKVEKVLETTSIKEYNQWVKKNKARYPGLEPILVRTSHELRGTQHWYTVSYYNQDGERIKEEVLEDSLLSPYVPFTNDRLILLRKLQGDANEVTVKNAKGQILFKRNDIKTHLVYTGIGVYIEGLSVFSPVGESTVLRTFNGEGQEIGALRGLGSINVTSICTPRDKHYCVFEALNALRSTSVIVLGQTGKELWRHEIDRGVLSLFISETGSHIGVLHSNKGKIMVFNENGNLVREYTPFGENWYWILSAFSDDGKWLATGFRSGVKFYNNKTGELIWEDTTTLKDKADTVKYVHIMENGKFILVLCNSHNMYIFDGTGKLLSVHNLGLGKRLTSRRIRDELKPKWFPYTVKKEKVLTQNWFSDVIGEYLIINEFTNGVSGAKTQGDTKIIYRIHKP
ncbi:MAG: WD40 repeat domain-containing protein [bacterium]